MLKSFINSSKIKFTMAGNDRRIFRLRDMSVGDTFIRDGAACMAVKPCHSLADQYGEVVCSTYANRGPVTVVNLQTGSVWTPSNQNEEVIPMKMESIVSVDRERR